MDKDAGKAMVAAFHYIRGIYRNISCMLLSCDPVMEGLGFERHLDWLSKYDPSNGILSATKNVTDLWLPFFIVRQYSSATNPLDIVSIAGVPWDPYSESFDTPVCVASRMLITEKGLKSFEPMRVAIMQVWDKSAPPDGKVRMIAQNMSPDTGWKSEKFSKWVKGERILSVSWPLLDIVNTQALEERLLKPLLAHLAHPWPPDSGKAGSG